MPALTAVILAREALALLQKWPAEQEPSDIHYLDKEHCIIPRLGQQWGIGFFIPESALSESLGEFTENLLWPVVQQLRRQVQWPIALLPKGLEVPQCGIPAAAEQCKGCQIRVVMDWVPAEWASYDKLRVPDNWTKVDLWYNISCDRLERRVLAFCVRLDLCFITDELLVVKAFQLKD